MPWAYSYSTAAMTTVLGLIGLTLFIAGVISLAALVTWVVVKISPQKKPQPKAETPAS
jgi:hypothetical protein